MRIKATFINGFNKKQAEKEHRNFDEYVMNKRLPENDSVVTMLISISEGCFGYWIASQTKMILLGLMRSKSNN